MNFFVFRAAGMLALVSVFAAVQANALAFVPPVIYFATLSLWSFVANAVLVVGFWIAARLLADRLYFGLPAHLLVQRLLSWFGRLAVLVASGALSLFLLHPLTTLQVLWASVLAGLFAGSFWFLAGYRRYSCSERTEKLRFSRAVCFLVCLGVLVTFVSAQFALETVGVSTGSRAQSGQYLPDMGVLPFTSVREADAVPAKKLVSAEGLALTSPRLQKEKQFSEQDFSAQGGQELLQLLQPELWFFTRAPDSCRVYPGSVLLIESVPKSNCYAKDGLWTVPVSCPVRVLPLDIESSGVLLPFSGTLSGTGSCPLSYDVVVTQNGFIVSSGLQGG